MRKKNYKMHLTDLLNRLFSNVPVFLYCICFTSKILSLKPDKHEYKGMRWKKLEMNKFLLSTTNSSLMAGDSTNNWLWETFLTLPAANHKLNICRIPPITTLLMIWRKIVARNYNRREIYPINMNTLVSNQF